jgi:hypothetical protein
MQVEYREEPCRSALNRVRGMMFEWSLNPYMGCAHRCTFCYVRAFESRADRPSDDRYGRSIRVKINVADVLARELARPTWEGADVVVGAATDPYQPAEGRYRLTRSCLEVFTGATNPFSIITRGPMIMRDVDVLQEAARRANVTVTFSIPTLDEVSGGRPSRRPHIHASVCVRQRVRRRGYRRARRDGADPPRAVRRARPARRGGARGARGGRDGDLGEPAPPQARNARALPRKPGAGLARRAATLRAALRRRPLVSPQGGHRAACREARDLFASTASATTAASARRPDGAARASM